MGLEWRDQDGGDQVAWVCLGGRLEKMKIGGVESYKEMSSQERTFRLPRCDATTWVSSHHNVRLIAL